MATYLITGVAGFIGSHLADALVEAGETVRGIDNFATGRRLNLKAVEGRIDLREMDVRDAAGVAEACVGVDYILHEAALPSVPRSVEDPRTSHAVNLDGTFNVLEGARAAGVKRVVFAASSSAYGNQPGFPRVETMTPMPIAPYPVQKCASELYMQSYWAVYGLETVCLRYFNIFGPRQDPASAYSGVMARFILQMLRGERPMIFGDGEQGRDFTYVGECGAGEPAGGVRARLRTMCAGQGVQRGVRRAAYAERDVRGAGGDAGSLARAAEHGPARAGDVRDSLADIGAAAEALGYKPRWGLPRG